MTVWYQGKGKINRLLGNETPGRCNESTCRLPHEVVEMIIAHLTHDLDPLKACSLTCRSWYITAAPHIHHILRLRKEIPGKSFGELQPLSKLHELGLIPRIKEVQVTEWSSTRPWFVPEAFRLHDLRYFSAFTNVQALFLEEVQIHRFVPHIERYFGHFAPTLRAITLLRPYCTPRQLSYFLSLFPDLDDITVFSPNHPSEATVPDMELVLFSAPKLRGRLRLYNFWWVETWLHLIASCGGLRFRHVDLRWVAGYGCAPILLEACAETLDTLQCSAG